MEIIIDHKMLNTEFNIGSTLMLETEFHRTYFISLAASSTALIVDEDVQLNAGSATSLSRQYSINFNKFAPVTTPGGTIPWRPGILISVLLRLIFRICAKVKI